MNMLHNMKFRIANEDQSSRLQHVLFSLGCGWCGSSRVVELTDKPYIYADSAGYITYSDGESAEYFDSHVNKEHDTEAFIEAHTERLALNEYNMKIAAAKPLPQSAPASQELFLEDAYNDSCEGFFSTDAIAWDLCSSWVENYGERPDLEPGTLVDVVVSSGAESSDICGNFYWDLLGRPSDIIKWRFHRPADAEYFKQPKTAVKLPKSSQGTPEALAVEQIIGSGYDVVYEEAPVRNKYMREIKPGVYTDVYDVLRAFGVVDPCLQHLVKKALAVGQRGHKDAAEDYDDIVKSAIRAQELNKEWS